MFPKQIIIKTTSNTLIDILTKELSMLPNIRYNSTKFNHIYTISIKCSNYYGRFNTIHSNSIYGSYIYLYTNVSLILSKIIIDMYEKVFLMRTLRENYFYYNNQDSKIVLNIALSILDPNYPNEFNNNYYLYRKKLIISEILKTFRKQNYIYIDSLINFSLLDYKNELLETIDKIVNLVFTDNNYYTLLKLIFHNWLFNN